MLLYMTMNARYDIRNKMLYYEHWLLLLFVALPKYVPEPTTQLQLTSRAITCQKEKPNRLALRCSGKPYRSTF